MDAHEISQLYPEGDAGEAEAKAHLDGVGLLEPIDEAARAQGERIQPKYRDLARLHRMVTARNPLAVLEFGVGFSTLVLADALARVQGAWAARSDAPPIRHREPFLLHALDTTERWIEATRALLPEALAARVRFHVATVAAWEYRGRGCHVYTEVPDVQPDMIYLDGPDPAAVCGRVGGWGWGIPERPVMAGDLLRMEPCLMPGCLIMIDGRLANARFLAAHLYRGWTVARDERTDTTVLELRERPLGKGNRAVLEAQLGAERVAGWPEPLDGVGAAIGGKGGA